MKPGWIALFLPAMLILALLAAGGCAGSSEPEWFVRYQDKVKSEIQRRNEIARLKRLNAQRAREERLAHWERIQFQIEQNKAAKLERTRQRNELARQRLAEIN